jgi:hypothetical protein
LGGPSARPRTRPGCRYRSGWPRRRKPRSVRMARPGSSRRQSANVAEGDSASFWTSTRPNTEPSPTRRWLARVAGASWLKSRHASQEAGPDWPGRSATSQWNRSPAKTGCGPENSLTGLACGTRSALASRCSRDLATVCLPVILATCGGCATRREAGPWWSIADGGDGVPARVRTRGAGTGGDRSIGLGR